MPGIDDLIQDWGGFERLVADLHRTGTVTVEHDVVLIGASGTPRQCDVVVRHREGLHEHLVVVECKYWQENVSRLHVDALTATVRDLRASKGVIMTAKGFQSGAVTYAQHEGIDLYVVRELADAEWGLPGRVVELVLQVVTRSLRALKMGPALALDGDPSPLELNIHLGERNQSITPLLPPHNTNFTTLEELLTTASLRALREFMNTSFTVNGGKECTHYMSGNVHMATPSGSFVVQSAGRRVALGDFDFELGIRIDQSRIRVDRSEKCAFVLAIENRISKAVVTAAKEKETGEVSYSHVGPAGAPAADDGVVKNGDVVRILHRAWFDPSEMEGLLPVSAPSSISIGHRTINLADSDGSWPA